jgi:hypothetical protein
VVFNAVSIVNLLINIFTLSAAYIQLVMLCERSGTRQQGKPYSGEMVTEYVTCRNTTMINYTLEDNLKKIYYF